MVDWREGLRRSAAVTGRGYLIVAIIGIAVSGYEHGHITQRTYLVTMSAQSVGVAAFTGQEAKDKAAACAALAGNPFADFAPPPSPCASVNHPETPLRSKWDWDAAVVHGATMAFFFLVDFVALWAVFRGLRWAALGFLDAPNSGDRFEGKRRSGIEIK